MTVHKDAIATGALWVSIGLNVILALGNVWQRRYDAAAFQSILVALLTAWMYFTPKIHGYWETKIAAAIAERETAELILADVKKRLTGGLRLDLRVEPTSARMH